MIETLGILHLWAFFILLWFGNPRVNWTFTPLIIPPMTLFNEWQGRIQELPSLYIRLWWVVISLLTGFSISTEQRGFTTRFMISVSWFFLSVVLSSTFTGNKHCTTGSRSTFELPSWVNLSGPVCTVPSSMDRTSRCNKVDAVRLYASYRLNLLLLKWYMNLNWRYASCTLYNVYCTILIYMNI